MPSPICGVGVDTAIAPDFERAAADLLDASLQADAPVIKAAGPDTHA